MADNNIVNNGVNKLNRSIKDASSTNSLNLENIGDTLDTIAQDLGDGLKLTQKKEDKNANKQNLDLKELRDQLEGLRVFAPELADVVENLIEINTKLLVSTTSYTEDSNKGLTDNQQENFIANNINTDSKDPKDLAGLTSLADITGTGFSIVGNILKDLYDLFSIVLEGVSTGQVSQALITVTNPVTTANVQQQAQERNNKQSRGIFAGFLQGIAGPLESVAAGLLMISVALAVLQTFQIDAGLLGTVVLLGTFMITTFTILNKIKEAQQQNEGLIDTDGTQEGSVLRTVLEFSAMVGLTAASLTLCSVLANTIVENWSSTLTGLLMIFGTAFVTLTALNILSAIMSNFLGEEAPITKTIFAFTALVGTISLLAILCGVLEPVILRGIGVANTILQQTLDMFTLLGVTMAVVSSLVNEDQLEAFSNILREISILIGLISVVTVILGVLPTNIVVQGLVSITLLVGLVDSLLFMLTRSIQQLSNVSEANIQRLMGVLITTTVLIGVLSVLTVVLGLMDTNVIVQGLTSVILISAIPLVLLEVMTRIANNSDKIVQALIGVTLAGILTVAVTGLAYLIIRILGNFDTNQVLSAMLAVGLTTILVAAVGVASIGLAALASALGVSIGPALASIGLVTLFTVAIAGLAYLLTTILSEEVAQQALVVTSSLALATTALVVIASEVIILGALAIPVMAASLLATLTLNTLRNFLVNFATTVLTTLVELSPLFASINVATFGEIAQSIASLNDIVAVINNFTAPSVSGMLAVNFAMAFALNFAKRIQQLGTEDTVNRVTNLANSLASLASNASGLTDLASAIKAVSEATKELNEAQNNSRVSIEAISGQVNNQAEIMQRIEKVQPQTEDDGTLENSNKMVSLLQNLTERMQQIQASLQDISQNQTTVMRRGDSSATARFMEY